MIILGVQMHEDKLQDDEEDGGHQEEVGEEIVLTTEQRRVRQDQILATFELSHRVVCWGDDSGGGGGKKVRNIDKEIRLQMIMSTNKQKHLL